MEEAARLLRMQVGIDRHANWPASVKGLPQVGGIDDANIERIVALKPDLVLLRPRSRAAEPLERLGIKVLALDAKTHADMRRVMETVARATGRPGAGEAFWRKLDAGSTPRAPACRSAGRGGACTSRCTAAWRRPAKARSSAKRWRAWALPTRCQARSGRSRR
jgi:hypothetical protein